LDNQLTLRRLEPSDVRPPFDCGDEDLNEFYITDSRNYGNQLMSVTYVVEQSDKVIAYFSVSNDAIKTNNFPRSAIKRLLRPIPREKRHSSMPAVKIGRLATCKGSQCQGIGTTILGFLKVWFTQENKTGCRHIIVDAYEHAIKFYEKNGFVFLSSKDEGQKTRLMYFDLYTFRNN